MKHTVFLCILATLPLCSCQEGKTLPEAQITAEMAYEGVSNYCHSEYDWSIAEDNPEIMFVKMGEETDSTYQVIFRSYTGAFMHFFVEKTGGMTKMVEIAPIPGIENEAGTINITDYMNKGERNH